MRGGRCCRRGRRLRGVSPLLRLSVPIAPVRRCSGSTHPWCDVRGSERKGRNGGLCDHARGEGARAEGGGAGGPGGADEAKTVGERNATCAGGRQRQRSADRARTATNDEFNGRDGRRRREARSYERLAYTPRTLKGAQSARRKGGVAQSSPRQRHARNVKLILGVADAAST
jgi:hypothetical protein